MGVIVGCVNQKGGVGKTTILIHLAAALARQGKKIVVVDGDPQGNATSWIRDQDLSDPGFFRLLVAGDALAQVVHYRKEWKLSLIPGNYDTADAMIFLAAARKPFETIANTLAPLRELVDFAFLDMPPSKNAGFREMLWACDYIVVPTQLERFAFEGVSLMAQMAQELTAEHKRGPQLLGIVPNMVRKGTNEHRDQMGMLVERFGGVVWPPIPLSVRVTEASSYGTTLFDIDPKSTVTKQMALVVERFMDNIGG